MTSSGSQQGLSGNGVVVMLRGQQSKLCSFADGMTASGVPPTKAKQ